MNPKTVLFLIAVLPSLIACTLDEPAPPPVLEINIPDTILECAAIPDHFCLVPNTPASLPGAPALEHAVTPEGPAGRQCHEKDRLRWETMLMHAARDCKRKLGQARKLINGMARAPPAKM